MKEIPVNTDKIETEDLDDLAEKAGGYVIPPWKLESNPEGERAFIIMRQYSLKHNICMSKFTEEDYRKMGIEPPKTLFPDETYEALENPK